MTGAGDLRKAQIYPLPSAKPEVRKMKKITYAIIAILLFNGLSYASATRFDGRVMIGTEAEAAAAAVATGVGDLYVADALEVTGGIVNAPEVFFDIPTASTIAYINGGAGTSGTVSTTTLVAAGTSYTLALGDYSNTGDPRNITCQIWFEAGASTTAVVGTLSIIGTDQRGNAVTESMSVSTTAAAGNYAYSSITSMALSVTSISPIAGNVAWVNIGTGVKIGLANNLTSTADILKVNEGTAATTTYTANTTYNTITFVNAPNATREYKVTYKVRSR